jgi:hypothetical protein
MVRSDATTSHIRARSHSPAIYVVSTHGVADDFTPLVERGHDAGPAARVPRTDHSIAAGSPRRMLTSPVLFSALTANDKDYRCAG